MNIAELLNSVVSWSTLLLAILIYGFAPGFLLRLLVLAYERGDPRRKELIAELYEVPRLRRPFWVAEQIETAIFDGLSARIRRALTNRGRHRQDKGPAMATAAGAERIGPAALRQRELQVLRGMAEGKSNAEIGRELRVSEDTVKTHARRLMRKLRARDRAHAVAIGFRSGVLG